MRVKYLPVAEGHRLNISQFFNFSASGSIKGMKDKFYSKDAMLIRCGSYIYHVGNLRDTHGNVSTYGKTLYFHEAH